MTADRAPAASAAPEPDASTAQIPVVQGPPPGLERRLLMIVDVQNDFCEGGALGVEGGRAVAERIAAFVREALAKNTYSAIAVTQDYHRPDTDNGGHFAAEPDFVDTWPVHCVTGSAGGDLAPPVAALVEELEASHDLPVVHIRKGYGTPAYSAMEGVVGDPARDPQAELVADVMAKVRFHGTDIVGLAQDYCVAATARDMRAMDLPVRVLLDLTAPVHPDATEPLTSDLAARGVEIITSREV